MDIDEHYLAAFFGKNAGYYLHQWRELQQGRRVSFNAAAFFAGLFWFVYRRMYGVALLLGLSVLEANVEQWVGQRLSPGYDVNSPAHTVVFALVAASLYALLGNWIYLSYARRKITRVLRRETTEETILHQLRRRGGTSWTFFIVVGVLIGAVVLLARQYPQYFR